MVDIAQKNKIIQDKNYGGAVVGANPLHSIWYVDSVNGINNQTRGESRLHPLATLTYAVSRASAGDTIVLNPGGSETITAAIAIAVANLRIVCPVDNPRMGYNISIVGTLDNISVTAADAHIEGIQLTHTGATANQAGIKGSAAAHRLTVKNCAFDDTAISSTKTGVGVELVAGADDQVVEDCIFLDTKYGVQIAASSTNVSDRPIVRGSEFYVGGSAFFGIHVAAATGAVQGMRVYDCMFHEADGDGSSAGTAWDGSDGTNATQGPILFGANVDQYMISNCWAQTALSRTFANIQAINAGANGEIVHSETAQGGDVTDVYSDTTVLESDSIIIESSVQVVESDSIIIESSIQVVESETTVLQSDSIIIESSIQVVESDLLLVYSDTAQIASDLVDMASDLVVIESDVADIQSDTSVIESDSIIIESSIQVVESETTVLQSDSIIIESSVQVAESDTAIIEAWGLGSVASDSIIIESSVQVAESDTAIIEAWGLGSVASDSIIIESSIQVIESETTVLQSDSIIIESSIQVVESETTVLQSDSIIIESSVQVVESDAAELNNWDVRTVKSTGVALTGGSVEDMFTVANGPIEFIGIAIHITTAVSANACNGKIVSDPTVGGSSNDMCTVVDIQSAAQGDVFYITGTDSDAMIKAAVGSNQPRRCDKPPIVMPGGIDLSLANSDPSTGIADVYLIYRPMAVDVTVT